MKSHGELNTIKYLIWFLFSDMKVYGEKFLSASKYSKKDLRQILGEYVVLCIKNHASLIIS